jgi:hypothetical protein
VLSEDSGKSGHCFRNLFSQPVIEPFMKILLIAGLLLVVLGIASLIVPVPRTETHGIKAGNLNIGVQTSESERVSPIVSAVLIAGGIALTIAGARGGMSRS